MNVPSFLTRNGSNDFLSKQKNLFDVLDSAEKEKKTSTVTYDNYMEIEQKSNKRKRKETKQFRGKESLFKEPVELPARFRKNQKIPDYQKNPHKWVKYSLADITQNDMSNDSNTAAALSFLKELKMQKEQASAKMEVKECESKSSPSLHQFCLRKQTQEESVSDKNENSFKPVFKSSKLIMPEYVVGQSKKEAKLSKKKIIFREKGKEVFLNHIHEYEDE